MTIIMPNGIGLGIGKRQLMKPLSLSIIAGLCLLGSANPTYAQSLPIEADATLGSGSSIVTPDDPGNPSFFEVTGGTQRGENLFHSFNRFSTPENTFTLFSNDPSVQTIINRVTGTSISNFDGALATASPVNFYFINPNGIILGRNASFDIGKSLVLSTADRVIFEGGVEFATIQPEQSVLSISAPIGLQMGLSAAAIEIAGPVHDFFQEDSTNTIIRLFHPAGLQLIGGTTLALVGGDITMDGGNLTVFGGNVELGAVKSGYVGLNPDPIGWELDYAGATAFGDINLTNSASVDVSGAQGGSIRVQARQLNMSDGSLFISQTEGESEGRESLIRATESITLSGVSENPVDPDTVGLPSGFIVETSIDATGKAGNLTIETPRLLITNAAQISNGTYGPGTGGTLTIRAQDITVTGSNEFAPSAIVNNGGRRSTGNAGSIDIQTNTLTLSDNGLLSSQNFGSGNGGAISIRANQATFQGDSSVLRASGTGLFAGADQGDGGNITLNIGNLNILGGAQVTSFTHSAGRGGDIGVQSQSIQVVGANSAGISSGIFTVVDRPNATGNAGNLTLNTSNLLLSAGGQVATSTFGIGNAGNLSVTADQIRIEGSQGSQPSGLFASVTPTGKGQGGLLSVISNKLEVFNGGRITTESAGAGAAGSLTVRANTIDLAGSSSLGPSALLGTVTGSGDGRDLTVIADRLTVRDGATIAVGNTVTQGTSFTLGSGRVGNLNLDIGNLVLSHGSLTAQSLTGDRGSINIRAKTLSLRHGSQINANALGDATGGNIDIQTQLMFSVATENNDITANAITNRGGAVRIQANQLLGIESRSMLSVLSDITASSEQGAQFSGVVDIKATETDMSRTLVKAPTIQTKGEPIRVSCAATGNALSATGKGGVPTMVDQPIRSVMLWGGTSRTMAIEPGPNRLLQANAWRKDASGTVQLLAQDTAALAQADCLAANP